MDVIDRLTALRTLMAEHDVAAYLVPSADPHQSEYVAATWRRRAFISGFDGSAGTVVVTTERAGLWTDSRYFIQAEQQLAGSGIELFRVGEAGVPVISDWLAEVLNRGDRLALDRSMQSISSYQRLATSLEPRGISLRSVSEDLVEQVWGDDRPALPSAPLRPHPLELAGETAEAKLTRLREAMVANQAEAHVLASLDDIAWLFNLRGGDVEYNPVFIAFALVEADRARLFLDPAKVDQTTRATLPQDVELAPYSAFDDAMLELSGRDAGSSPGAGGAKLELAAAGRRVWVDPSTTNQRVADIFAESDNLLLEPGPVPGWKAVKNTTEIDGMRAAHVRDGVAMVRLLRWLDKAVPAGGQTELSVDERLTALRAEGERFVGLSFATIVGYAAHGAIVHYEADEDSSSELAAEGILLIDAGAHYLDGTTDITRTVTLGSPTAGQRQAYTAVLQGHLALGRARFPAGTNGYQLDVLARAPLWARGLDYGHGTGHGVGAYLCAHEGPFSISLRQNMTPLRPGHVTSNEPGFYRTGDFGVRIENLVLVVEAETTESGAFLTFEDLTLCPYDRRLIDVAQLQPIERAQVDAYHKRVRTELAPLLAGEDKQWLLLATEPL